MREKEHMRDKRVCAKKKKESKKVFAKRKKIQRVMDVGAMFIDLLKKYEYVAK